jgi:hypothetical protein
MSTQPELIPASNVETLIVDRDELAPVCASVRDRGGIVEAVEVGITNSEWRIRVRWLALGAVEQTRAAVCRGSEREGTKDSFFPCGIGAG